MCYSGNIVSEMSTPTLPPCPQDLEQLVLSEYPVLTDIIFVGYDQEGFLKNCSKDTVKVPTGMMNTTLAYLARRLEKDHTRINESNKYDLFAYADTSPAFKALRHGQGHAEKQGACFAWSEFGSF